MPSPIAFGATSARSWGWSGGKKALAPGTVGIFALGLLVCCVRTTTRDKYTYASDTNGSATAASAASYNGSAAGNSTRGIFALGCVSGASTTRNKYTYASDTNGSATAASATSCSGSAAGNSTRGIFALGYVSGVGASTTRNKYTYACDTNGTAAAASAASYGGSSASNGTCGVNV